MHPLNDSCVVARNESGYLSGFMGTQGLRAFRLAAPTAPAARAEGERATWPFGRPITASRSNAMPAGSPVRLGDVRVILNILWLVLCGFWMALGYLFAALLMFILIITIPFALQALKLAIFALWPFGRTLVKRPGAGAPSLIGNVLWLVLAGWWLALGHLVTGVLLCLTIIGIPLGLGNFKLIPVSLWPFGREIVPIDYAGAGETVSITTER